MSAVVAPRFTEEIELFWFWDRKFHRYHAFELLNGDLEPLSICEVMPIEKADDIPEHSAEARHGRGCINCLLLASVIQ